MTEIKQRALDKIATELQSVHSAAEDQIHNWISDQDDDDLFNGILKVGKTFKGSFNYLVKKANELSKTNGVAVMTDQEAYDHIRYYFLNEVIESKPMPVKVATSSQPAPNPTPKISPVVEVKPEPKPKKAKVEMSMSIFDFIDEPINAPEHDKDESDDGDIEPDE